MKSDFDFRDPSLFGPVVFRPSFNNFEAISATQAWSLFFTASQEDKALGLGSEAGRFFTNTLIAISTAGILWTLVFKPF